MTPSLGGRRVDIAFFGALALPDSSEKLDQVRRIHRFRWV